MEYKFDVFISYHRRNPVKRWVENHFFPRLDEWLTQSLGRDARIFFDSKSIDSGSHWPSEIRDALLYSTILVPILSPTYFTREWCVAEWDTMRCRQEMLGLDPSGRSPKLICPVWFFDGESFPQHARDIQHCDLRTWNKDFKGYEETKAYEGFLSAMQELAVALHRLVTEAPPWHSGFPTSTPQAAATRTMMLPRL